MYLNIMTCHCRTRFRPRSSSEANPVFTGYVAIEMGSGFPIAGLLPNTGIRWAQQVRNDTFRYYFC